MHPSRTASVLPFLPQQCFRLNLHYDPLVHLAGGPRYPYSSPPTPDFRWIIFFPISLLPCPAFTSVHSNWESKGVNGLSLFLTPHLCSSWFFLICPLRPESQLSFGFLVSVCIWIDDWTKASKSFNYFNILFVYVKVTYFFCCHDFCLLDVRMKVWKSGVLVYVLGLACCDFWDSRFVISHL